MSFVNCAFNKQGSIVAYGFSNKKVLVFRSMGFDVQWVDEDLIVDVIALYPNLDARAGFLGVRSGFLGVR